MKNFDIAFNHLTLVNSQAITQAVSPSKDGILTASDSGLTLYSVDDGKLVRQTSQALFATVRRIARFALPGDSKKETYVIATSDSGKISMLRASASGKVLVSQTHETETFGKSGCRRVVPGQYIAVDPRGRAVMVAALEKQKIVYVITRDNQQGGVPVLSSPLETSRPNCLTIDCIGVDVGYENPIFACIEVDFGESDRDATGMAFDNINLVHYELDLGLNHTVRKWAHPIDYSSNMLIPLPGGRDGPSGVLVCSENYITWVHPDFPSHRLPIPHRPSPYVNGPANNASLHHKVLVSSFVVHKMKKTFFIGDMFKVTADFVPTNPDGSGGKGVTNLKIKYFDTIPVSVSLILLKSGFLFAASEFGNHFLYQLENLGDDDETQQEYHSIDLSPTEQGAASPELYFNPRALANISAVDELESLSPLVDAKVLNMTQSNHQQLDATPQIYTLCGRGARSSFRVLRHGLETGEFAVSDLPGTPNGVWTLMRKASDQYDSYIVVSFANATLVLAVGESGVEESTDTGFLSDTPTLDVTVAGADSHVQVYPLGIRHIRVGKRPSEWKTPDGQVILYTSTNERQVVVGLSNGEIVYFELDTAGNLNEFQERKEMSSAVTCLCLGPVPTGRVRSKFLAIGCQDNTVRVLSLEPGSCLEPIGMQTVPEMPQSVAMTLMKDVVGDGSDSGNLFLHIGLANGVLLRGNIDTVTGALSDSRLRFIGTKQVGLFKVDIGGRGNALLVLSSRPWLAYDFQGTRKLVPISYQMLDYGTGFSSEQCPQGIVAVAGNTLRIITLDRLGDMVNQGVVPLSYTPRRIAANTAGRNFVVIESDYGVLCESEKKILDSPGEKYDSDDLPLEQFGLPRALESYPGKWASCIRLIEPFQGESISKFELDLNEAAFCLCVLSFRSDPGSVYAVVGTARDVIQSPRSCSSGFLRTYKILPDGMVLHHVTPIEDIPNTICAFQGRMLVGMGNALRIYELGKKKMLRKCETRQFPNRINEVQTIKDRIIVSDIQEGPFFCRYISSENRIVCLSDSSISRWMTCFAILDYNTIIGGDKFGNVFCVRVPTSILESDDQTDGSGTIGSGSRNKFHIGETITSIHKTSLVPGGRELVLYTTVLGSIGILVPFATKQDAEFFQTLEMHMRQESASLVGRDHFAYRSTHIPVRCIVDGDFCEEFVALPAGKQREIAEGLEKSTTEILKKIEDARVKVAF